MEKRDPNSPSSRALDEPDRQPSGFVRIERLVRDLFPEKAEEVMRAYHVIYARVQTNQGRDAANRFLHECASYLAAEVREDVADQQAE